MANTAEVVQGLQEFWRAAPLWAPLAVSTTIAGFWFGRRFQRSTRRATITDIDAPGPRAHELVLQRKLDEARAREANDNRLREAVLSDESELWQLYEAKPPARNVLLAKVSRPKIIVVANNKGGVGKTTLTAGLATFFEKRLKQRVLLIDLDYQGSLTNWMIKATGTHIPPDQSHRLALANALVDGSAREHWATETLRNTRGADGLVNAQLITADYSLTRHENKLMLGWLVQGGNPDIRFHIAEALLGPHVQDNTKGFDVVIIDAPPRLTVGVVGALIAATHLVVPTILDPLSAETVGSFLKQAWTWRTKFNPGLDLAGVVATMTTARAAGKPLTGAELDARGVVLSGMKEWGADAYMFNSEIQDLAAIRKRAGLSNPYFDDDERAARMFDAFGQELCQRIEALDTIDDSSVKRSAVRSGTRR